MKIKSIFDGWTSKKQCFGPLIDDGGRYCAMGWGYVRQRDMGAKDPTKRGTRLASVLRLC